MKWLALITLIYGEIVAQSPIYNPGLIDEIVQSEQKSHSISKKSSRNALPREFDLIYESIRLTVNPSEKYIRGNIEFRVKSLVQGLNYLTIDCSDSLKVNAVLNIGGQSIGYHKNNKIHIQLKNLTFGQFDTFFIAYEGIPPTTGLGSFSCDYHGSNIPILSTLSEPYGASDWMPCTNDLEDKIDSLDIYITCPEKYQTATNGLLVNKTSSMGKSTFHWKHNYPIATYLIAIAVTEYAIFIDSCQLKNSKLPVYQFMYREDSLNQANQFEFSKKLIQLFDSLIGEYPFIKEKYGHAQWNKGGGMEHQTMSFMKDLNFELNAHELAHQWFGNKITCQSWGDIWLNEGFATYLTGIAYEHLAPIYFPLFIQTQMRRIMYQSAGSVYCTDTINVGRIFDNRLSYSKGAMILHQLRWLIGDTAFYKALRNYAADSNLTYQFATSSKLIQHFESASSMDLKAYFQNWLYGEGYPIYLFKLNKAEKRMIIAQNTTHPSVTFYKMKIPVSIYAGGSKTNLVLDYTYNQQEFPLNVLGTIDSIKIDPDNWLIGKKIIREGLSEIIVANNPVQNSLILFSSSPDEVIELVQIVQLDGKKCMEILVQSNIATVDVSKLTRNFYLVHTKTNKGYFTEKIWKE